MQRRYSALILAPGLLFPLVGKAASIQYTFSYVVAPVESSGTYVPSEVESSFVTKSSQISAELLLEEQTAAGNPSPFNTSLIQSNQGVGGAGVKVTQTGTVPASPATIASLAADPSLSLGDLTSYSGGSAGNYTSGSLTEGTLNTPGPEGTLTGSTVLVPLGVLSLNVGSGATTFTIGNANSSNPAYGPTDTEGNGYNLDTASTSPTYNPAATTTFIVVPEPASASLLAVGGILLLRRRRIAK